MSCSHTFWILVQLTNLSKLKEPLLCIHLSNTCQVLENQVNHKHFYCLPEYIHQRLGRNWEASGTCKLSSKTIFKTLLIRLQNISQSTFGWMSVLVEGKCEEIKPPPHTLFKPSVQKASAFTHQKWTCLSLQNQRVCVQFTDLLIIWSSVKQITLS